MKRRKSGAHALPRSRRPEGLDAGVGDRVLVPTGVPGQERAAVVVEVQNGNGTPPYVVVWSDNGQRALLYPPGNARIERVAVGSTS
ncbi:DUF1918 domain-containing protein [Sporichthya polymorpha]|uniref:DUF1918 domain-containing protein n=1 Tax=Sporichthya polymorpha TaxID=35751 RepID=UPI0024806757|nr:DUF1918 domain-containing protein [Sporichthya polymorpha]